MNEKENRKYQRVDPRNLVSYTCLDDSGLPVSQGMGRTLNVNETGILLETFSPIDPSCTVSLSIGLNDDVADFKGLIVHQRTDEAGRCRSGIRFVDTDEKVSKILEKFIAHVKARKSGS